MLRILMVAACFIGAQSSSIDVQKNITGEGYPAETHYVTTKDGYILTLHRIPYGKNNSSTRTCPDKTCTVLLMHSILAGSNSFIYAGPETGIAFNLADAGCDVWMGNARGNRYSRNHTSMDPDNDKEEFFDFSYEEIGTLDLPAMIDHILENTKSDKLHYVGHTQGSTVFLVLNSMSDKYHSKIASAHLLAAIGYQRYFPNQVIKTFSAGIDLFHETAKLAGQYEFFPSPEIAALMGAAVNISVPYELVAGCSMKQVVHFGQNFRDKSFKRFDNDVTDKLKNIILSNREYDLSKVNVNITMYYAQDDQLLGYQDVLDMVQDLPNAKAHRIAKDDFNHLDYLASRFVKPLVTDYIMKALNTC